MGHRDSSAQLGRDGGFFGAGSGDAETASVRDGGIGEASGVALRAKSAASWVLLLLMQFYITFLSAFFGGACKFHPSCSNYAHEAIARHGARRGLALAVKRLLRCRPFTKGGFDPVPEVLESQELVAHSSAQERLQ